MPGPLAHYYTHDYNQERVYSVDAVAPALTASGSPRNFLARSVALRGREGGATAELGGEQAGTLRASQGGGDKPYILVERVRRLTPLECERLQGFPDGWTDSESDAARYRMLGNAVCVPVVEWIGRRLVGLGRGE